MVLSASGQGHLVLSQVTTVRICIGLLKLWRRRITASSQDLQSWHSGSIPDAATKQLTDSAITGGKAQKYAGDEGTIQHRFKCALSIKTYNWLRITTKFCVFVGIKNTNMGSQLNLAEHPPCKREVVISEPMTQVGVKANMRALKKILLK